MGNFILFMFIFVMVNLGSIAKSALLHNESWNEIIRTNIILSIIMITCPSPTRCARTSTPAPAGPCHDRDRKSVV